MRDPRQRLVRRIGAGLCALLLALIGYKMLAREPMPLDGLYWLARWPLWVLGGLLVPLIVLRLALWRRRDAAAPRPGARPPDAPAPPDAP